MPLFINTMTYYSGNHELKLIQFLGKEWCLICPGLAHLTSLYRLKKAGSSKHEPGNIRHRIERLFEPRSFSSRRMVCVTTSLLRASILHAKSSASGASASSSSDYQASTNNRGAGGRPAFPPSVVVEVKALACQLPYQHNVPLSRFTVREIGREAVAQGIVATISGATVWRWLTQDAIRPWRYRSWIFPRDPNFSEKAGRVLDLYERGWEGASLTTEDYVISADEKTSIQARRRKHATMPPAVDRIMRVEHEYSRCGAWAYFAAWDVHRARVFGRCESTTGIAAFDRLVEQVMAVEPYHSAHRVFWVVDNGSSHRGKKAADRLRARWPNIVLVHTPVHASWLNQVEIYFSVIQRKVLTPNDFYSLTEVEERLQQFQDRYEKIAKPFQWKFTRNNLTDFLLQLTPASAAAA